MGAVIVAKAPADGYTLLMGAIGTHAINVSLTAKLAFNPVRHFTLIT